MPAVSLFPFGTPRNHPPLFRCARIHARSLTPERTTPQPKTVSIVAFAVEFLPDGSDSGRSLIRRRRSRSEPVLCHQMEHTFRLSEVQAVVLTSAT